MGSTLRKGQLNNITLSQEKKVSKAKFHSSKKRNSRIQTLKMFARVRLGLFPETWTDLLTEPVLSAL